MKLGNAPVIAGRIAEEISSFGRMLREPAAREAFTAFIEKRRPDFAKL
jgi:enoyl-CoA hydratase/carnithine racemase